MITGIHAANIHDSIGTREAMRALKDKYLSGIKIILADGGYIGDLKDWIQIQFEWILENVNRNKIGMFKVLSERWIVVRTLAWLSFHRKMSKDYERLPESGIAFILLSMIRCMVNRISK